MSQADLFAAPEQPHPYADLGQRLWTLAKHGVYFGSSSWKYDSWQDEIYVARYKSKKDFEQNCLAEYAQIFPAVGGDFSFYNWPAETMVARIDEQTPKGFKIGLKATEFITLKRYPNIARWGDKAGRDNPDFLNAKLFTEKFLGTIEPLRKAGKLAPLIIEFTAFPKGAFTDWTEFAHELERFFDELRRGVGSEFEYGVEVRTRDYIHQDFWAALKAMKVAPILNSWTRTPPLDEQFKLFQHYDFPFVEARAVMRPGRTHDEALELFTPYDKLKEVVTPARRAMTAMVNWALENRRPCYIFVNNHLEGCAYKTIDAVTSVLATSQSLPRPTKHHHS